MVFLLFLSMFVKCAWCLCVFVCLFVLCVCLFCVCVMVQECALDILWNGQGKKRKKQKRLWHRIIAASKQHIIPLTSVNEQRTLSCQRPQKLAVGSYDGHVMTVKSNAQQRVGCCAKDSHSNARIRRHGDSQRRNVWIAARGRKPRAIGMPHSVDQKRFQIDREDMLRAHNAGPNVVAPRVIQISQKRQFAPRRTQKEEVFPRQQ